MSVSIKDLFPISHYEYGEAYYGSDRGMRFRIARDPLENVHFVPADKRGSSVLAVTVWPEPDSFQSAPEEKKIRRDFPFTQEGLEQAAAYLNEVHDTAVG